MTEGRGGAVVKEEFVGPDPEGLEVTEPEVVRTELWAERVRVALARDPANAVALADKALTARPADGDLLLLAAVAALVNELPARAQIYLKRYQKRSGRDRSSLLLTAIALAQQDKVTEAWTILHENGLAGWGASGAFVGGLALFPWLRERVVGIERAHHRRERAALKPRRAVPRAALPRAAPPRAPVIERPLPRLPVLTRAPVSFETRFEFTNP
jgi:hypothetical protein